MNKREYIEERISEDYLYIPNWAQAERMERVLPLKILWGYSGEPIGKKQNVLPEVLRRCFGHSKQKK